MKLIEKISIKILRICKERNITPNTMANKCLITQSTLYNLINCKVKNPKLMTIIRICDGMNIELKDFFDDEVFTTIESGDLDENSKE